MSEPVELWVKYDPMFAGPGTWREREPTLSELVAYLDKRLDVSYWPPYARPEDQLHLFGIDLDDE